ncbi:MULTISPECIES: SusC/RagA family TonB-linked outer membrane protein [Butyricimonas]|uniref:SusC/RagA family TonB-linked outer membrane protein n=2 Tax=Butyricimonas virosa TaxID=544645 RepID=A0ABX7H938_9BACT|nr:MULTISPECIES: SusC/RagA family TonB-linked outer membrane protein [Butyricimonas]MBO4959445.1 SusC/RagA family TonB-linked outer membrane protein [Butyricimonas sp.]MCI7292669.1 SusC/RagA family TonB-linked outer membrane protein [Butyricimonas virosa]MDY6219665.1 SusC/RagA family TonB-linked outer membrane protein [Butyricimonas virosa]QRO50673.1 SusC/RagA family TonB-linked outer membrane protein [Butyricimonas virosa]
MRKKRKFQQTLRKMKLLALFMLLGFCTCHATISAQEARIDLKMSDAALSQVFRSIEQLTEYMFIYKSEDVQSVSHISVDVRETMVRDILDQCLKNTGLSYLFKDKVIIIQRSTTEPEKKGIRITGKVTDEKKEPLPGVTVMIKGTKLGTVTDVDGKYALTVPEGNNTLVFSMVGMKDKEEVIGKRTGIDVVLEEAVSELEDVVVTGYYTQAKNSFTGAARTITAEELQMGGNQNILTALQNIDPSFMKIENNLAGSNPNVVPEFQIRGAGSISGIESEYEGNPNTPVFIVDGFETTAEKVYDMDPYRVASITLLKDAAATAIYGSRASNGVVVITTNAPASGKMQVSYNVDASFYIADLSDYNVCNAVEKLAIEKAAGMYSSTMVNYQLTLNEWYNEKLANIKRGYDTYWLDKPLDAVAVANKHSLRLDGGNDNIRYGIELGYSNTPGVMKESGRRRLALGMELQYIYKSLTFRNNLTYSNVKATNSPYGSFSVYTKRNPYVRYKDDDGNYIYKVDKYIPIGGGGLGKDYYNPLYNTTLNTTDEEKYNDVTNNFGVDWTIMDGLRLKGSFSFTHQNTYKDNFKPAKHTDFADYSDDDFDRRGAYVGTRGENYSYDASLVMTYFYQLDKHVINANLGWNLQESVTREFTVKTEGFPNENLDYISFATQYEKEGSPSGSEYTSRLVGFLGNLNYSYDERYLLDFSFREDASSRFGSEKRWAPFWSVGLGWNLHNEGFLKDVTFVNRLKIRGSYGLTGSQNYNPYQAMTTYKYLTGERYHHTVGAEVMALGNEKLGWQRTLQQNYGLDIDLWDERINFTGNYYVKLSKDVLTSVTLPPSLGFGSYMDNLGEVKNYGYELSLRVALLKKPSKQLYWSVNATALHNKNKLLKISNALRAYNDAQDEDTMSGSKSKESNRPKVRYIEGKSMNSIWVNQSLGVDPATGYELFQAVNGDIVTTWSTDNYVIGGCTDSDLEGTFGTNLAWKGFQLNAIFRYNYGGQIYNQTLVDKVQDADLWENVDRRVFEDRWQKPGDKVMFTRLIGGATANVTSVTKPTSRFVEDNNWLELSTLNVSYEFKMRWMKKVGLKRLKALFYMNDVFRVSTVKQERGIDYPFARNFSIGLQARF